MQPETTGNWTDNRIGCDWTSSCGFTTWREVAVAVLDIRSMLQLQNN